MTYIMIFFFGSCTTITREARAGGVVNSEIVTSTSLLSVLEGGGRWGFEGWGVF